MMGSRYIIVIEICSLILFLFFRKIIFYIVYKKIYITWTKSLMFFCNLDIDTRMFVLQMPRFAFRYDKYLQKPIFYEYIR